MPGSKQLYCCQAEGSLSEVSRATLYQHWQSSKHHMTTATAPPSPHHPHLCYPLLPELPCLNLLSILTDPQVVQLTLDITHFTWAAQCWFTGLFRSRMRTSFPWSCGPGQTSV